MQKEEELSLRSTK